MTSAFPEPNFIDRDPEIITKEWVKDYEFRSGKVLEPAQIDRISIDNGAYRESLVRIEFQESSKQNLVRFAKGERLDYLGELVGVKRLPPLNATTTIRFSLQSPQSFDVEIPPNVKIETKDGKYIFSTQRTFTIRKNEIYVDAECACETSGADTNGYLADEISNLISPLAYVETITNINTSFGGADTESDDSYRERIMQAPESFSNAGSRGAYIFHTYSVHQSIKDVAVMSPSPGVVEIYPLTEDGEPSDDILKMVENHLNADYIRPLTDFVKILKPEKLDFNISAELTLYTIADIESLKIIINQKLADYKLRLRSKLGSDIVPTQIIAILNSISGVYSVDLKLPYYKSLSKKQWANLLDFDIKFSEERVDE